MVYGSNLWVSLSYENGIASFNGSTWNFYSPENNTFPSYNPEGITADSSGKIWFGTKDDGIVSYDGTSWTDYNTYDGNPSNICYRLITDKNGNIWYGTNGAGLVEFNGTTFTDYYSNATEPDPSVYAIAYDSKAGNLWVGTGSSGLVQYNGSTFKTRNTFNSDLTGDYIRGLAVAPNSDVWVATAYNGLCKFDGTNWTIYNTLNSNLPNDSVWGVAIDKAGNVWAGTFNGLAELTDYYAGINVIANDIHGLKTFPDPTEGESNVQFQSSYGGEMQIKVLNVLGQEVLVQSTAVIVGSNTTAIDLPEGCPSGVYIVQLSINGQSLSKQIVKE
jgi:ligand-binding sensor domain-containing protein